MPATLPAKPTRTRRATFRSAVPRRLAAVAAAAALVTAPAALVSAPLAHAASSATASPSSVAPAGRVTLAMQGCGARTARVTSTAFGEVRLETASAQTTGLSGSATVYNDANPGTHRVVFECGGPGGERVTVSLQVTPGAARGGTGGSIGSMSTVQTAVGGALAVCALAGGVWVLRRRASA
ncbi:hypothetical protein ACIGD1_24645 [Streptomyces sp. NPDC085612]|uniref:hypothetical protein n=1 Tax=Streptomyces sp. NPDC085612 TaxID=3365732 RepID=UPI0037D169F5